MARWIERLRGALPNPDEIVLSVHCHDDLGLAVANSLAAVRAGARQVECTVNGIGERAGNAALEEVVMALATRPDWFGCTTGVDTRAIADASRLLATLTGVEPTPNKAIVGANAFAHEAGIHQHGVIADRRTYEIMRAEDVGRRGEQLVLGKHSGRHALAQRLETLGIELESEAFERLFEDFKLLCAKRKQIFDGDLVALVVDHGRCAGRATRLESLHVVGGTLVTPTATVRV
jgi:2-isopropylmalate synthase